MCQKFEICDKKVERKKEKSKFFVIDASESKLVCFFVFDKNF
jgi:hypothetical protein